MEWMDVSTDDSIRIKSTFDSMDEMGRLGKGNNSYSREGEEE